MNRNEGISLGLRTFGLNAAVAGLAAGVYLVGNIVLRAIFRLNARPSGLWLAMAVLTLGCGIAAYVIGAGKAGAAPGKTPLAAVTGIFLAFEAGLGLIAASVTLITRVADLHQQTAMTDMPFVYELQKQMSDLLGTDDLFTDSKSLLLKSTLVDSIPLLLLLLGLLALGAWLWYRAGRTEAGTADR